MTTYALRNRPLSFATAPRGWIAAGTHPDFRHGTVTYDAPLSRADMEAFELVLVPTEADLASLVTNFASAAREAGWHEESDDDFRFFLPCAGQYLDECLVHADREVFARRVWDVLRRGS